MASPSKANVENQKIPSHSLETAKDHLRTHYSLEDEAQRRFPEFGHRREQFEAVADMQRVQNGNQMPDMGAMSSLCQPPFDGMVEARNRQFRHEDEVYEWAKREFELDDSTWPSICKYFKRQVEERDESLPEGREIQTVA